MSIPVLIQVHDLDEFEVVELTPTPTAYTVLETACEACGEVNTHLTAHCPIIASFQHEVTQHARVIFPAMDKFALFLGFGEAHIEYARQSPA